MIRQPILTFLGHVDSGKTSIQDFIRGTNITEKEAGGITQKISSTNITTSQIKKICGNLLNILKIKLNIPGILMVDSPGHAAFNNLRKRGGNLADIAVLVIDIKEGIMPQTKESLEILKSYKTPFVIALNKIDAISSFRSNTSSPLILNLKSQPESTVKEIETKLYDVVGKLSESGLNAERFDRIDDYTKQIAIIPCSAKTGDGIPELLAVLAGLAQKYLEDSLSIEVKGAAKGTILEIKEMRGVGKVLDVIIYDGSLKQNDKIGIATLGEPIITKVRSIFEQGRGKLVTKKEVSAAAGVLIVAPEVDDVIAGMPVQVIKNNEEKVKKELMQEIKEVVIQTDKDGVIIKADTLGSLEALSGMVKEKGISIKRASIGHISKHDIAEASAEKELQKKVILGFNVKNISSSEVKVITNNVIYKILDDYDDWVEQSKREEEQKELKEIIFPAKVQILRGCVFRQSHPAIVGVRVLAGKLKNGAPLIKEDGSKAGEIKSVQLDGENVSEAGKNEEVAISLPGITVGRQVDEDTILYTDVSDKDFVKLKKLKKFLKGDEIEVLKEIAIIKRKAAPLWGI
ncbi:MAG: translation initiation factor IF-2 [Candidatus Woesearchaeota archaeon]